MASTNAQCQSRDQASLAAYLPAVSRAEEQMAQDVAAFLTWTAEPSLIHRQQMGWFVMLFLAFATTLGFLSYKSLWAGVKPKK